MASVLESALKKTIGKAFKTLFLDATLYRDTEPSISPAPDPFDPGEPTTTEYACKAIHDEYAERFRLEGTVQAGDRKILILADSLDIEPAANDRIEIRGQTFSIIDVMTDPAKAVWTCRARA